MNHSVVVQDLKGDDALDSLVILLCLYSISPSIFSRNVVEISTHNFRLLFYFILMQHPNFLPSFAVFVSYKGRKFWSVTFNF